ncbi:MAG TPA: RHS repeat-associated core domain-containing protein [Verrucomicrobiae bacterium]|nr:RHS repeat-associated core domain-containing protein [Verrucomicrobiae bacterium]
METNEVRYVYDGNLVIQERDMNNLPQVTYTRGKDLSGSSERAGGIGGLLARSSRTYSDGSLAGQSFYHSDANGNVTMLIDSNQGVVAKYLYDAFGNMISKSGLLADANLYRFSSKEWHANSGLAYYLYRYYDPNLQRWLNRDPLSDSASIAYSASNEGTMIRAFRTKGNIGPWELHAPNIYSFVGDAPTVAFDSFGLNPSGAVAVTAEGVGGAILSGLGIGILAYEAYEGFGGSMPRGIRCGDRNGEEILGCWTSWCCMPCAEAFPVQRPLYEPWFVEVKWSCTGEFDFLLYIYDYSKRTANWCVVFYCSCGVIRDLRDIL